MAHRRGAGPLPGPHGGLRVAAGRRRRRRPRHADRPRPRRCRRGGGRGPLRRARRPGGRPRACRAASSSSPGSTRWPTRRASSPCSSGCCSGAVASMRPSATGSGSPTAWPSSATGSTLAPPRLTDLARRPHEGQPRARRGAVVVPAIPQRVRRHAVDARRLHAPVRPHAGLDAPRLALALVAFLWPAAMLYVVMATANHWWLDAVGGAGWRPPRARGRRPRRRGCRPVPGRGGDEGRDGHRVRLPGPRGCPSTSTTSARR